MILVDGNSLGYAAASHSKPYDGMETGTVYHFINRIREIRIMFDGPMIVLWDGRSWRYDVYAEYKGKRNTTPQQTALRDNWKIQMPHVRSILTLMGIDQMLSSNMEADDLAARIATVRPSIKNVFVTSDRDWLQLIKNKDDVWYDIRSKTIVTLRNFESFTGFASPKSFVQGKALMGDIGDNITGVGGIGPAHAKWLLKCVSNLEEFLSSACDHAEYMKSHSAKSILISFMRDNSKRNLF